MDCSAHANKSPRCPSMRSLRDAPVVGPFQSIGGTRCRNADNPRSSVLSKWPNLARSQAGASPALGEQRSLRERKSLMTPPASAAALALRRTESSPSQKQPATRVTAAELSFLARIGAGDESAL